MIKASILAVCGIFEHFHHRVSVCFAYYYCLLEYQPFKPKHTALTAAALKTMLFLVTWYYSLSGASCKHRIFVEGSDFKGQTEKQRKENKFLFFSSLKNPSGTVQTCCLSAWTALTDNSWQSFCHAIGQLGHCCHGYRHTQALLVLTFWQCSPTHSMERELQGMMKRETSKDRKWNTNLETTKEEESVQAIASEPLYPGGGVWVPHQH